MIVDLAGSIDPDWRTDRFVSGKWLDDPELAAVLSALRGEAFFVGGCVRNALLGEQPGDIDLATPLTPDEVSARLAEAGLSAVPTGLEHGTITAVSGHRGFEITTFRADVETHGRHATVAFSTDMSTDAERRDLTINALYADGAGRVIDPLGGLADLDARRIRFIGDPHDRIREDYLRILRFFRFTAWYGGDGIEPDGLAACAELAEGIGRLARERIGAELRKLLAARDPAPAMAAMQAAGVLWRCLAGADTALLAPLVHAEAEARHEPDWLVRLAALGATGEAEALRLSNADATTLEAIRSAMQDTGPIAATAFRRGARVAWARLLLAAAAGAPPRSWHDAAQAIDQAAASPLPIRARDLIAAGMEPGPGIGRALAHAEAAWVDSGFSLDKAALLTQALHIGQHS
ncbi:CCA tRNA nucleotidyltransferase [Limibaculum sp. M0105]|uniref:CCA tRNA nucleotidyltransferase n=1 Tax=Thermohalobaculum xanthum TaxID=2753746 RepID=A0A8J7MAA5_9RHOB|nr:CCA tRNA nucleotidyltransferase [Thermohalobaculum xanthum]MBK0400374.1 CCA tRNA nucleotidyltransferase [Thermohalobaculum xanthum]